MWSRSRRALAAALVAACALNVAVSAPAWAAPDPGPVAKKPTPGPSVKGVKAAPLRFVTPKNAAVKPHRPTATAWPKPADATVTLSATRTRAAGTPVWFEGGRGAARLRLTDQATAERAGANGPMVIVTPSSAAPGRTRVGLDYRTFAEFSGGNYGSRLRLVQLPACAATTPEVADCRTRTPLKSANDPSARTVSAQVALAGTTVVAAVTDPGSDGAELGSYAASDLKPSGSWAGGGNSGAFTYSYPITVPPAASDVEPSFSLSYNSGAIDGQTASTQTQSSWLGDGWGTPNSYIEQTFTSCRDKPEGRESPKATDDLCYAGPILTLSLNGASTALVWNESKNEWRPENDDGAIVTRVDGSDNGTVVNDRRWWQVVTRGGMVYQFGRNKMPAALGGATSNSVDYVPVYSPHEGGPCWKSAGFAASVCPMARRWNLDHVADVQGNAMTYHYTQDLNRYGQNLGAADAGYVRDSFLEHIEYGFTPGRSYTTGPNRVEFTVGNRCAGTCGPLSASTKALYPDVPFDLVCTSAAKCTSFAPSFFSTRRLTSIITKQVGNPALPAAPVDTYALDEDFPATGDGTSPSLWLKSIKRTGHGAPSQGTSITLPAVTFASIKLPNRVDTTTSGFPSFYRHRVASVVTESGSKIDVSYFRPRPCGSAKPNPASNTDSCFPVRWTPTGLVEPIVDWFNKYAVEHIVATDPVSHADSVTTYAYPGGAAWHYDDNELVKAKHRSYGQFRGYAKVQTLTGDLSEGPRTKSQTTYYRGMSRNNNSTVLNLVDSVGGSHEDKDKLAGSILEETVYRGETDDLDSTTITSHWVSEPTATRSRSGLPALTANRVAPALIYTRQAITNGGSTTWRTTQVDNSYDDEPASDTFGVLKAGYRHTVPVSAAHDECTVNTYAPVNKTKNLIGLISQTETVAKACGGYRSGGNPSEPGSLNTLTAPASVSRPAETVSVTRTFYDDPRWSDDFPQTTAPTRGLPTMVRQAEDYSGGAYVWAPARKTTYDAVGRIVDSYDGRGYKSTATYTDSAAGLPAGGSVTNPLGHTVGTTVDPRRGTTLTNTGVNNEITTQQYDDLGRLTGVWLNSRPTDQPAHRKFSYVVAQQGVSSVTTQTVNDFNTYNTSIELYDAQLRPRQTQADTPNGGRMISDTFYDSRGWVASTNDSWWDSANSPSAGRIATADDLATKVRDRTVNTRDFLGRPVIVDRLDKMTIVSTTVTVHGGDRVTVVPPLGGTATSTVTDPDGRTTALAQYTSRPAVTRPANTFSGRFAITGGTTVTSQYAYDERGSQNRLTDAAGNTWTTQFDLLGRVTSQTDPDAGTTKNFRYDGNGNLLQSEDARGKVTSSTYDELNRKTAVYAAPTDGQTAATRTAAWVYDNSDNAVLNMTNPKGRLTSSSSYSNGAAYKTQVKGYNIAGAATGETVTIPDSEGALAGTYTFGRTFTKYNLLPLFDTYPNKGGLPTETVAHSYSNFDLPRGLANSSDGYNESVFRDEYNRVSQSKVGNSTNFATIDHDYDPHTGLSKHREVANARGTLLDTEDYDYDLAGNLIHQKNTRTATNQSETQCFAYDQLIRLTEAWTGTDDCATAPTDTNRGMVGNTVGGGSAYWTSWTFDALGNRTKQIQRNVTGGADNTTTYQYDGRPHTLTSTTSTAPAPATSFAYDQAGNMTSRNAGNGPQTLTWNDSGQLAKVTGPGGDTTNIYDADGNLLLQKNPSNTTLYLPSQQHVLDKTTGVVTGTRYYSLPGGGHVVRTGTGTNFTFAVTDSHGTPTLYLDNTAQNPTWRQFTPYGEARGTAGTYPDNRGFLNKPANPATGLTRIGARDYDPVTGSFISPDPVQEKSNPQQWQGYAYATNNPITFSDPSGLAPITDADKPGSTSPPDKVPGHEGHVGAAAPHSSSGHSSSRPASVPPRVQKAQKNRDQAKKQIIEVGKAIGKIAMDELGITDALDCITKGAVGACLETALTIAGTFVGGLATKILRKYGLPWKWAKGVELAKKLGDLGKKLYNSVSTWWKESRIVRAFEKCAAAHSFKAGTLVLMADGTRKPIEKIKVGDRVTATDPQTGKSTTEQVTATHLNVDEDLTDVEVADARGNEAALETTQHHPFWDDTAGTWVDAKDLDAGHRLRSFDGTTVWVAKTTRYAGQQVMYDLTVDTIHTYYVIAGKIPVLVHNCDPSAGHGPVEFSPPPNATAAEIAEVKNYVAVCEQARCSGQLSSTGRVGTSGTLRRQASGAAAAERRRAQAAGTPYSGVVGHGPDTAWTGNPVAPVWIDMSPRVNSSLGGQVGRYPVGYIPTRFIFKP